MSTSAIVIGSEAALALYPILIKTVPTNLSTQLVTRLLVYSGLAYLFATDTDVQKTWGNVEGAFRSSMLGLLTLLHIGTSYYAFQQLPTGVSMSLFYTYPLFNLLGAALFFKEEFSLTQILLVLLGFLGAVLVSYGNKDPDPQKKKDPFQWKGLLSGLLASMTESAMYFAVRTAERPSPFFALLELYPGAILPLLAIIGYTNSSIDLRPQVWARTLSFNTLIGFLGYSLRFYAIPRLPTIVFSLLSFVGVLASFFWGYLFVNEIPSWTTVLGGGLIAAAAAFSPLK
jgi:drug/metabolite transporter (DMT)-like permease